MSKQKAIEVDRKSPKQKAVEDDWKSKDALEDFHKIMKAEFAVRGPSHAKWHEYCKEQTDAIMMRIAVSFFGDHGPEHVEQGLLKITDILHSYNDNQQAFVNKIFKRLMKLLGKGTTIYISRVMIGRVDKEGISYCYIMAVRVGESSDGTIPRTYFIDHVARTYNSWSDFLKNNRLPYGFIIYPRDGKYSLDGTTGDYVLDAGWNKSRFPAAKIIDYVALAFGVVGAAVCVASIFFPPLCGYHLVAGGFVKLSAIWGGARCGYGIFDNVMHGQSVLGRESIPLWGGLLAAFLDLT
ncbi:Protein F02C12.1 [Aphelenchoides avenae]|nr:Protein F02C12.1 [Aphelenchus avenae]